MGVLIHDFHIAPREAWGCTLREFCIILQCKKKPAMREESDTMTQQEILDFFKLREVMNVQR